jgi:hypothetical protein
MADIYNRTTPTPEAPLTADFATISWGDGDIAGASQISIQYAQQVQRRRCIGNQKAMIWAALPSGQITIQRLMTKDAAGLFTKAGFNPCELGTVTLTLKGCANAAGPSYTALGCIVSQYQVSAEAEGLTCVDNVVIDFMQLEAK